MKRMLIIAGFAGNDQYMEDTTNRIINYIFDEKFEELLSLVVIHYGNDFVKLVQFLEEKMKYYKDEGKILQSEFSKTSLEDVGIYTQITDEMGGKLKELRKKKEEITEELETKMRTEEEEDLRNKLKKLEEDENKLKIKFNDLQMKNRLKSDIREYNGNFKIRKRKLGNNEVAIMKLQNEQENLSTEMKLIENELKKLKNEEIKVTEEEQLKDIELKISEKEKALTEKDEKINEINSKISALQKWLWRRKRTDRRRRNPIKFRRRKRRRTRIKIIGSERNSKKRGETIPREKFKNFKN
uniref:Uncharacterized protein n=1 Tax=Meloidogyne enterolobii TaxID=390850 RepID=A0A6V7XVM9_MELEN|nr:unnamed protein product [Meloidogyne enterolobii]